MEIYTSNRLENLLDVLADQLSGEKCDAASIFSRPRDVVVIQSLGMAKWLQQNLAEKNGIAAHIEFPFLKNFISDILISYGYSHKKNSWDRETLCWRIYKLLADFEDRFEVLSKYVAGEQRRRYQLAEKLGSLYDQYMVYRWDWVDAWSRGKKAAVKPGSTEFLDSSHEEWQMMLWQELSRQSEDSFQHLLLEFIKKQNFTREQLKLPEKISIFGVTNMPTVFIDFFEALSSVCEVHFFYLNPCAEYWGDISTKKSLFVRRSKDEFPDSPNALLKSWGLLGRDFLNQLLDRTEFNVCELFQKPEGHSALHEIQKSVLQMNERFIPTDLFDESIQINACHNPRRELEVLHDYLIKILQQNKHIEPRDIIVMAPNIQDYSPHIKNVFDRENRLPFSISDQDISTSPLISTYKNILQLYRSRLSGNEIFEIIEHPDVLKKFSLKQHDTPQLREWIKEAAICWGKDAEY
ncbi:MAG: exodeoxyribonuclease V subunit gamma, partial [Lentisphaeraceae bacterium]|nr:exodeoxyribonuclease V subunit gamma [Lentisphaeraceae bacterium]